MVKDIAFTAYPAKDVSALREFYSQTLGFSFNQPFSEDGVEKYAETQIGGGWFAVITDEWATIKPVSGVAFEVDDMTKTLESLKSNGVQTEDVYDTPVCKISGFTDPAGNRVTLHQTTVPH